MALRPLPRNYVRDPAVTRQIERLADLPASELARHAEDDALGARTLRPETLVWAVRELAGAGDERSWSVARALIRQVAPLVSWWLRGIPGLTPAQREEAAEELAVAFYIQWHSLAATEAFWEVRFRLCLKRKVLDIADGLLARNAVEVRLDPPDDQPDANPLQDLPDPRPGPEQQALVQEALGVLPEEERTCAYLYWIEGWTEEVVAQRMGVTTRTVRNRLRRARARLAAWHRGER